MNKHRLVITIREGYTYNELFTDNLPQQHLKSVYTPLDDKYIENHKFPLKNSNIDTERFYYKSYFYNSLGKNQKDLYRTCSIDFSNREALNSYLNYLNSKRELVEKFYEDGIIKFFDQPNDPEFMKQRDVFRKLKIEDAWDDATKRGEGVIVSVIDSGVEPTHPDLVQNLWMNSATKQPGFIHKGNRMFDLSHGNLGHGTPITGIIGAAGNDIGTIGIAPKSQIQMHMLELDDDADEAFMITSLAAIQSSLDNKAKIVNCSFGIITTNQDAQDNFINKVKDASKKMLFVFATGNLKQPIDVDDTFLTFLPEVLKVGALDNNDRIKNYSNFGRDVVYAYGDIHTTTKNGGYDTFSGTSAAAPQVAAICALMLSHNSTIPPAKLKEIIEKSCDNIAGIPSGFGRVNAKKAMQETMKISGRVLA